MLNDAKLRSLKPKEKVYRETDFDGLCLEVKPTGKKFWRYRFRLHGKQLMMTLGAYPAIGLAEARKKRDEAKAVLDTGISPVQDRAIKTKEAAEKDKANSFKDVAQEYIEKRLVNRSPEYVRHFKDSLERDVYPKIGKKNIRDVTSADILNIMDSTIKRIRERNMQHSGEVSAIQNRTFIGAVIRYAIATLRAEYDPTYAVRDVVDRPEVEHARPLEKKERQILITKLNSYKGTTTVKNAGLCLMYTMLRTVEIRRMTWDHIDFEDRVIKFNRVSRHNQEKRVMKKNRTHIVPMSEQVFNILKEQHKINGNREYVFAAIYKEGMLNKTTLNRMLDFIGLRDVTAHDFRATASTLLNEKGYDKDWIELQLAHTEENKTRASYNHARWLQDRRKMLQDWADIVDSWKN
ncbi:tyrosine-type recombinase/integrase [Acinetobacter guerrae]|uniref:tyrosine-type recombinase/integrase n=1 Tax=Acinetobacter guerrae TaxID=1843371 RepID=UPI00128D0201|nr:integrase arm-type DNA-binding domain-containing protein [Acinetobacter guerrae]MPW43394.1 integrase [Acinetobacter guerrae]